jgi:hypothetical protein
MQAKTTLSFKRSALRPTSERKHMNKLPTIIALSIVVSSLAFGYEIKKQASASKIIGVWKSLNDVNGEPQVILTINNADNKLNGKFVFRGLTVNGEENVRLEIPLTNIIFDGTTLSFRATFSDQEKVATDWELRLRNESEASFVMTKEEGKPIEDAPQFTMQRANRN